MHRKRGWSNKNNTGRQRGAWYIVIFDPRESGSLSFTLSLSFSNDARLILTWASPLAATKHAVCESEWGRHACVDASIVSQGLSFRRRSSFGHHKAIVARDFLDFILIKPRRPFHAGPLFQLQLCVHSGPRINLRRKQIHVLQRLCASSYCPYTCFFSANQYFDLENNNDKKKKKKRVNKHFLVPPPIAISKFQFLFSRVEKEICY